MARLACDRCHAIDRLARPNPDDAAPDLTRIGLRLRIDWIARFLREPSELGIGTDEPHVRLSDDDAATVARYFAAVAERPYPPRTPIDRAPSASEARRGERLFAARGCPACHALGDRAAMPDARSRTRSRAPDLRFTRERMEREVAIAFVVDPSRFSPATTMPALEGSADDARAIVAYVFELPGTPPSHGPDPRER